MNIINTFLISWNIVYFFLLKEKKHGPILEILMQEQPMGERNLNFIVRTGEYVSKKEHQQFIQQFTYAEIQLLIAPFAG